MWDFRGPPLLLSSTLKTSFLVISLHIPYIPHSLFLSHMCHFSSSFPLLLSSLFEISSYYIFLCSLHPLILPFGSSLPPPLSPTHLSKSVLSLTTSYQKWRSLSILNAPLQILIFFRLMSSSPLLMLSAFSYSTPRCLSACTQTHTHKNTHLEHHALTQNLSSLNTHICLLYALPSVPNTHRHKTGRQN